MTQDDFDRLIEQLIRQEMPGRLDVERAIGADLVAERAPAEAGWIEYRPKDGSNRLGATSIRYETRLEADPLNKGNLAVVAVQLLLNFSDEDRLSHEALWKKYGREAYNFYPDKGLCLFHANGVRVFMEYSGRSQELYVSRVSLTWGKKPEPERYQIITGVFR